MGVIKAGDRAGICVSGLDAKQLERGSCVGNGSDVVTVHMAIAKVSRVRMFKRLPMKHGKFHVTVGNDTVMAKVQFFGAKEIGEKPEGGVWDTLDFETQEHYLESEDEGDDILSQWGLIKFDKPVVCRREESVIGSRLDTDEKCRLAWEGEIVETWDGKGKGGLEERIVFFSFKEKRCKVDRVGEEWKREEVRASEASWERVAME